MKQSDRIDSLWSADDAWRWWERIAAIRGCNYLPRTAVNDTEMWQAKTFDLATIAQELGWAQKIGYNGVRVFLQYIVWEADPDGFVERLSQFLTVANRCGIRTMPILFDDCAFDAGRTQTYMHWGSTPDTPVPDVWQHDILHPDGRQYDANEAALIKAY